MLTVREVMKALSHEHPDAPVMVVVERLFYVPDADDPEDINKNAIDPKLTERSPIEVSSVRPLLDGRVVIE